MTSRDFIICMVKNQNRRVVFIYCCMWLVGIAIVWLMLLTVGCKTTQPAVAPVTTNAVPIKAVTAPPMPPMPTLGTVSRDTLAIIQPPPKPSNTVVALVWSNASYSSPTNFFYYDAQQSSDFTNWTDCGPWWFAEIHPTVVLVTNSAPFMFFRLKTIPVLPIIPPYSQYPLAVINNGQGIPEVQQMFSSELASTRNILVLK